MRKTKIIATLGPATDNEDMIEKLVRAGVNVFRLNMSHAKHEWVRAIVPRIRKISARLNKPVGILMDTQGPAIRTGDLPAPIHLNVGDKFTFITRGTPAEGQYSVDTNYEDLVKDVNVGDVVLIDNGVLRMVVREKTKQKIKCEVLTEGDLGNRRHINLPGVKVNLPALTQKDLKDVEIGMECDVDFIALSFVREANDLSLLRQVLATGDKSHINIVAKIEDQSAVKNIDEIIQSADAVMVARGDLGIECPYEELPIIQRRVVKKCVTAGKPVIVATHMLESMIQNPMPTRAEITDVSNAIYEEVDAIMLSGETATGKYPVEAVEVLDRVAQRVEISGNARFHQEIEVTSDKHNIASSAVLLADKVRAAGICVFTKTGNMAALCAGQRPRWSPIFAFTAEKDLPNRLCLRYGIYAYYLSFQDNPEDNVLEAKARLQELSLISAEAKIVIISDVLTWGEPVGSIQLRTAGVDTSLTASVQD